SATRPAPGFREASARSSARDGSACCPVRLFERDRGRLGHRERRRLRHLQPLRAVHAAVDPPVDLVEELVNEDCRGDLLQHPAVSETRIGSPIPSASRLPIPTALLIAPLAGGPASVTPRCSGYGTRAASIRYARIIVGTWLDLTEILKSR